MSKVDKLVAGMKAKTFWVLIQVEEIGSNVLVSKHYKTPFSKVLAKGPQVEDDVCKVGDRVMFREGLSINTKEEKFTEGNFLWVHRNNILGTVDEELAATLNGGGAATVKGANGPAGPEATP